MKRPLIAIIVAIGPNRVIGQENQLPWKLPRDMKFFRRATLGNTVVMGRKTFESLGCRPLPKRRNIIITRNQHYQSNAKNIEIAHSIEEAIELASSEKKIFIIGGGELYRASLALADEVFITEIVDQNLNLNLFPAFPGDTYFPALSESEWKLARPAKRWLIASDRTPPLKQPQLKRTGLVFRILYYKKKQKVHLKKMSQKTEHVALDSGWSNSNSNNKKAAEAA